MTTIEFFVNGVARAVHVDDPDTPLLYVLRNDLGLRGPHYGCGLGQCGACTVHFDGEPLRSCVMPISAVAGAKIVTLEGLGTSTKPHPLQQAHAAALLAGAPDIASRFLAAAEKRWRHTKAFRLSALAACPRNGVAT